MPNLVVVVLFVVLIGAFSGMAYATGFTIVGREVDDDTRGRVFAFFHSAIRVILFAVIAVGRSSRTGLTGLFAALRAPEPARSPTSPTTAGYNLVILLAARWRSCSG